MTVNFKANEFFVPIAICYYVAKNKCFRTFQVFMALKGNCSGHMVLTVKQRIAIANKLGISKRTFDHEIIELLKLDWIGKKGTTIYIRKLDYIKSKVDTTYKLAVYFNLKDDLLNFKPFVVGSVICHLVKIQEIKDKIQAEQQRKYDLGFHKKRGNISTKSKALLFKPVSCSSLAQIIGCSLSTAYEYKKLAHENKYINLKHITEKSDISKNEYLHLKKYEPEKVYNGFLKDGHVYFRHPDEVNPILRIKQRKSNLKFSPLGKSTQLQGCSF
jgi:hypothetical protein